MPFESLVELLARSIMATHNTLEPTISVLAGFVAGVIATTSLSGSLGLAALPIGYVTFQAVRVVVLGLFLRPRMNRIGGELPWSWHEGARGGKVDVFSSTASILVRRGIPAGRLAVLATLAIALTAGTVFAGVQTLSQISIAGGPQITPWARIGGTRPPVITPSPATE